MCFVGTRVEPVMEHLLQMFSTHNSKKMNNEDTLYKRNDGTSIVLGVITH